MKTSKNFLVLISITGALLIAGLFLFSHHSEPVAELTAKITKPSQLNFSESNQIQQVPKASARASATETLQQEKNEVSIAVQKLEGEDRAKWFVFESIYNSKNDNDPRMDRELKKMSVALHEALYEKYDSLLPENHSGKALIAYLIARDLTTTNDAQFLKKVFQESPCLSLPDCKTQSSENSHHSATDQTTLIIAQLNILYSLEQKIQSTPQVLSDAPERSRIVQVLIAAENYPVPTVHEKAHAIRTRFSL